MSSESPTRRASLLRLGGRWSHTGLGRFAVPIALGLMGALMLSGVYLGIVSLAESPRHALDLFWQDKLLVVPIILGFGIQVGLYAVLKTGPFAPVPVHVPGAGATTTAGGGVSTVAMVACCAHHMADVLPILGLSAAAAFLANWKVPFMLVGLATNLVGISVMARMILNERRRLRAAAVADYEGSHA